MYTHGISWHFMEFLLISWLSDPRTWRLQIFRSSLWKSWWKHLRVPNARTCRSARNDGPGVEGLPVTASDRQGKLMKWRAVDFDSFVLYGVFYLAFDLNCHSFAGYRIFAWVVSPSVLIQKGPKKPCHLPLPWAQCQMAAFVRQWIPGTESATSGVSKRN